MSRPSSPWMGDQLRFWTTTARAEIREPQLEMLSSPLVRLLEAADDELRDEIVAALRGYGDNVLGCLMPALRWGPRCRRPRGGRRGSMRSCGTAGSGSARSSRDRCARKTTGRSNGPGADATLCGTLGTFLGSRSRRAAFEWPLATDRRRHVHTQIDSAGLPVRHQTRRQGRPYTLVLTKTDELFTR